MLTTFALDEYVFGALDAGASGFLLKGDEPADLIHAIRVIAAGDALLAPSVTRRLIDTYVSRPQPAAQPDPDGLDELTTLEREVLGLVATGLTNTEIAQHLHLSPLTAKTHVSRVLMKLGARDRVQLVVIAGAGWSADLRANGSNRSRFRDSARVPRSKCTRLGERRLKATLSATQCRVPP